MLHPADTVQSLPDGGPPSARPSRPRSTGRDGSERRGAGRMVEADDAFRWRTQVKLLVTAPWNEERLAEVRSAFPDVEFVVAATPEEQLRAIPDADAVFGHVTRDAFRAAGRLRWVQSHSAGVEWTARVPELLESDVVVCNTRGAYASTIAEHTFGMLIALARGFIPLLDAQRAHVWQRPLEVRPVRLQGMTLGVVGLGNIGRAIARIGHAFEMHVIAADVDELPRPEHVAGL